MVVLAQTKEKSQGNCILIESAESDDECETSKKWINFEKFHI
jgi:hypothetical protein